MNCPITVMNALNSFYKARPFTESDWWGYGGCDRNSSPHMLEEEKYDFRVGGKIEYCVIFEHFPGTKVIRSVGVYTEEGSWDWTADGSALTLEWKERG